eukprot:CAMPEP_0180086416 /NCGR_PEP_ID=MMETSP0985-20121206/21038_1 /TAXON_ID=483367 /ORGANISM="non described non described, Strain CCMP 2436" /LENGTH=73 /DNA_ID=CAMNT_0022020453 /DNA_START=73 /DNA_END=292 /DNA_ORIENTATION=-
MTGVSEERVVCFKTGMAVVTSASTIAWPVVELLELLGGGMTGVVGRAGRVLGARHSGDHSPPPPSLPPLPPPP